MNKTTALVALLVGIAIMVAALIDVFGMSKGVELKLGDVLNVKSTSWPTERIVLLVVGIALGLFGALLMFRGGKKK